MENEKALVFAETKGLDKNFDQSDSKPSLFPRQYLCSFCWRNLPNNSVRFNGIGACPSCFKLSQKLANGLREHRREYAKRFKVKK